MQGSLSVPAAKSVAFHNQHLKWEARWPRGYCTRLEIFLVASCYRNVHKLRPGEPLGSYADFTFYVTTFYDNDYT